MVHRVTPACGIGSAGCSNPWSRGRLVEVGVFRDAGGWRSRKRQEGLATSRGGAGYRRGKPSGDEKPMSVTGMKQDRKGCRAEQSVKRLRKPEGAAQPEVVDPVLVAARYLIR